MFKTRSQAAWNPRISKIQRRCAAGNIGKNMIKKGKIGIFVRCIQLKP